MYYDRDTFIRIEHLHKHTDEKREREIRRFCGASYLMFVRLIERWRGWMKMRLRIFSVSAFYFIFVPVCVHRERARDSCYTYRPFIYNVVQRVSDKMISNDKQVGEHTLSDLCVHASSIYMWVRACVCVCAGERVLFSKSWKVSWTSQFRDFWFSAKRSVDAKTLSGTTFLSHNLSTKKEWNHLFFLLCSLWW